MDPNYNDSAVRAKGSAYTNIEVYINQLSDQSTIVNSACMGREGQPGEMNGGTSPVFLPLLLKREAKTAEVF